jgi:hypothetical protein
VEEDSMEEVVAMEVVAKEEEIQMMDSLHACNNVVLMEVIQ